MLHTHHILPKYLGGTDDPSNLVELTIEDHAEAHRLLYEQHGNLQDFCAWKGLAGILSKQEIIEILCSEGGKIGGSAGGKKAAEIHRRNKTGLFREDKEVQRLGNIAGAALGGSSGAKNQIENRIGIFGYSEEEKQKSAHWVEVWREKYLGQIIEIIKPEFLMKTGGNITAH